MEADDLEQLKTAISLLDRGHVDQGVEILESLRSRYPDDPVILGSLGMVSLAREEYGRAEQLLNAALEANPTFYPALVNKGILLVNLGDIEGAITLYDRAIALNPKYVQALSNKGNALALLGRVDDALALYERVIEIQPGFADAHYNRAYTLYQQGDLERALEELEQTVTLNPTHVSALHLKTTIHLERGEEQRARHCKELLKRVRSRR